MKINFRHHIINISCWFLIALPLIYFTGYIREYLCAILSTAAHELGHVFTAGAKGCRLKCLNITPAGFSAEIEEYNCSKQELILIYISGPCVNLCIAVVLLLSSPLFSGGLQSVINNIAALNLFLALFNLLPALPLDGGKILFEILSGYFGIITAGKFSRKAAVFLSILFIIAGICQIVVNLGNFSLLIIGIFVLASLINGKMEAAFMNMKQIVFRRERLMKKGIYPVREIVAMKWMRLGECVKHMDYDRFHIVHVMNEDMSILAVLTENEIIDAMLSHASDCTLEELVKMKQ